MAKINFKDIIIEKVICMDIEREDRSVGIFGNDFIIIVKDEDGIQQQLHFSDDQIYELLKALQPVADDLKAQEDMDKLLEEEHKDEKIL
jgi:hypothetical protein